MPSIPIERLRPGVFISLENVAWLDHPFLLNRFRIANPKQIQLLREMGIKTIEWDPGKSSIGPLPETAAHEVEVDFGADALKTMLREKRGRAARVLEQRERLARCERLFEQETGSIGQLLRELDALPNESHGKAKLVVERMVGSLIKASSVAVHLVNLKSVEAGPAHHAMNVMVLSLLIGKAIGAEVEEMRGLGVGAMFHDLGKTEIPPRVLRNAKRLPAEEQFYQAHVGYGIKNVARIRDVPVAVRNIIACHHERWDGAGFPNRLAGAKIPRLARIVAIANRYDNLCNPFDLKVARTPAEAVSQMYKQEGAAFDPELLQAFVKAIGVYPPGSFVALDDGSVGLIVESNSTDLLRPLVMLYDPGVPRGEALLLDLRDTDGQIESALNPAKLPLEVVEYLAPRGRVDYYVDGA
jgi:HD-GYP domain-containing protein (c-di-GMP phosphodiesterase class II)